MGKTSGSYGEPSSRRRPATTPGSTTYTCARAARKSHPRHGRGVPRLPPPPARGPWVHAQRTAALVAQIETGDKIRYLIPQKREHDRRIERLRGHGGSFTFLVACRCRGVDTNLHHGIQKLDSKEASRHGCCADKVESPRGGTIRQHQHKTRDRIRLAPGSCECERVAHAER